MKLNEREIKILNTLKNTPGITSKEIKDFFHLTRNQLNYSINQINNWLELKGYQKITRTQTGKFILSSELITAINQRNESNKISPVFTKNDRKYLILLMLISNKNHLSLFHFSYELEVSKNTILRDLNKTKKYIGDFNLSLEYNRSNGYTLNGKEWNIRKLLEQVITHIYYNITNGSNVIKKICGIKDETIFDLFEELNEVEDKLSVKYAEHKLWLAPYILSVIIKRISMGMQINNQFNISFDELSDTKEYYIINEIFSKQINIILPNDERLYLTLFLLTLNVLEIDSNYNFEELEDKINSFLNLFESKYAVQLENKEDLRKKLYIHLSSAVYRIKYNFSIEYPALPVISKEYANLIDLVKGAMKPLESLVNKSFPEQEISFIAILIGGSISSSIGIKDEHNFILEAVVVCPNGVLFSNIIQEQLKKLLPYVKFHEPLSIRSFNLLEEPNSQYDLIFAYEPLDSYENAIVLNNSFDEHEKNRITSLVAERLQSIGDLSLIANIFMDIISKYTEIDEESKAKISDEFVRALSIPNKDNLVPKEDNNDILDLLSENFIQVAEKEISWKEAISLASRPLVNQSYINISYVEDILESYPKISSNIILGKHTAIPHSVVESGSYETGMSLLKLKKPILSSSGKEIFIIIVVSTTIQKNHIKAINQLLQIVTNEQSINKLVHAQTKEEIYQILLKHKAKEVYQ